MVNNIIFDLLELFLNYQLYCGFYKHEIEENLVGAEIIFEAMGYKRVDGSTLLLEGPICPDQVAHVSRDSLVAFVECEVKTIIN